MHITNMANPYHLVPIQILLFFKNAPVSGSSFGYIDTLINSMYAPVSNNVYWDDYSIPTNPSEFSACRILQQIFAFAKKHLYVCTLTIPKRAENQIFFLASVDTDEILNSLWIASWVIQQLFVWLFLTWSSPNLSKLFTEWPKQISI